MHSVNYISCNIIENRINKVLDVKPLVPFIFTEYANSLTNNCNVYSLLFRSSLFGHLNQPHLDLSFLRYDFIIHFTKMFISGQETGNVSHIVENILKKRDCFKLCQEFHLCKWFIHIPALSLCSLLVEPKRRLVKLNI